MAIFNQATALQFYATSCIPTLSEWNLLNNSEFVDSSLKIYSGGYAGVKLTSTLGSGLTQSKYRYLQISVYIDNFDDSFNYTNYIDVVLKGTYTLNGNSYTYYHSIPISKLESTTQDNLISMTRCLTMTDVEFSDLEVYIKNHTESTIYLNFCSLLVSVDVSSSQLLKSVNQSAGLQSVTAYSDGFSILYAGQENPLKIWWVDDGNGGLGGLNVNNERLISFYDKTSEVLT